MRRLITALIVSLAMTGAAGQLAAKKIATYGVAFYNLENLFDLVDHAEYKGPGHPAAGLTAADDDAEFERLMLERFDG